MTEPTDKWWTGTIYEVLPDISDESDDTTLSASFTPNNGIRIQLLDADSDDPDWRVFDFTPDQAELIGNALVRWAKADRDDNAAVRAKLYKADP